jgi:hypothetical protein
LFGRKEKNMEWFWISLIVVGIVCGAAILGEGIDIKDRSEKYCGIALMTTSIIIFISYGLYIITNIGG